MTLIICLLGSLSSIFDFRLPGISGKGIQILDFKRKRILLVNKVLQGMLERVITELQSVFSSYNKFGPGAVNKFGRGFNGQQFAAGITGGFLKGAEGALLSNVEYDSPNKDLNLSFFSVGSVSVGANYTKKLIAKSLNKEYKKYLSKNLEFDESPKFNFFFQIFAYSAGGGFK